MNNENTPAQDQAPTTTIVPPVETAPSIDAHAAEPATAQQLANVEQQMSSFEKATLGWAKIAVLLSAVAAIFVCAQWWEMHEGGKDTHDLAVAAGTQAAAANTQSQQAIAQTQKMSESVAKTDDLIRQATEQAKATNRLAVEAKRTADYAKQNLADAQAALRFEESPWINIIQVSPVDFPDGSQQIVVGFMNYGKSPAFDSHSYIAGQIVAPESHPTFTFVESLAKGVADLSPGQPNSLHQNGRISSLDVLSYKAGQKWLYLRIAVWYKDYWNTPHLKTFCQLFDARSQNWVARKPERCEY